MTELEFNTEGITDCPMSERATREECLECIYHNLSPRSTSIRCPLLVCIYKDIFTEEEK